MNDEKITRKIYIMIGIVLSITAIVMFKVQNDSIVLNDPPKNVIWNDATINNEGDSIQIIDGSDVNSKVDVEVNKFDIRDYTDDTYWNVVLVNKKERIEADRPVVLGTLKKSAKQLDARVIEITDKMIDDAARDGVNLTVASSYRSYSYQNGLFNKELKEWLATGLDEASARVAAAKEVAEPGTSEHQLGLAIDFITVGYTILDTGFENTKAFEWLSNNAHKYGWILRYNRGKEEITGISYEPWHWRYVGPELAEKVRESGLCYEEFLGKV